MPSLAPARLRGTVSTAIVLALAGCSPSEDRQVRPSSREVTRKLPVPDSSQIASLSSACLSALTPGSVQVARVAPEVEEGGVAFDVLGDRAHPGVQVCDDVIYAAAKPIMAMMGERDSVVERDGMLVVGTRSTRIPIYRHNGVIYVKVIDLARDRRALFLQRGEHRMDAVVWPQAALRHLKESGLTQGAAYQTASKEGLIN